ncbi:MAG: dolichyl-phosphate mannose synthase [Halobacteriovoraceae bacterium]|nr:dolichyl-phosphate mannose synthase [Halobacteriovoraceae bacterium]|tara:strand:+ start:3239 stop:3997 length:759 start_codon:yes stop_codon:yes gene_type:complete
MKGLVAITCYNCRDQVSRVIDSLDKHSISSDTEIILIDNRSIDGTASRIVEKINNSKFKKNYKFFLNNENYGLGGSQKIAFTYALKNNYDYIAIIHGDDQANIKDFKTLLNNYISTKKTTLGSRFMSKSKRIGYQKSRVIGNIVLNIVFTLVTFRKTSDLGSGINLFSVQDLRSINLATLSNTFNFNVDLLLNFYSNKASIDFFPITWTETDQISNAKNLNVALGMLNSLLLWRLGIRKEISNLKLEYTLID